MKLFVIESLVRPGVWHPVNLREGTFKDVLAGAQARMGLCVRVKRVKTPAERDRFDHLPTDTPSIEAIEWVN